MTPEFDSDDKEISQPPQDHVDPEPFMDIADFDPFSDLDHILLPSADIESEKTMWGDDLRAEIAKISEQVNRLESTLTSLPYSVEYGSSEWFFAKNLFAQKEGFEQEVTSKLDWLRECLTDLEQYIEQCRGNLEIITSDAALLNLQEPKESYLQAEEEQENEYRRTSHDRDAVDELISRSEAVLSVSQTRKFPVEKPKLQAPFLTSAAPPVPPPQPRGLNNEINDLLDTGPLGPGPGFGPGPGLI